MTTIANHSLLNLPSLQSTAPAIAPSYPPLTGDELLEFCSIRLQAIDQNIGAAMGNQQTKQKEQELLQNFENAVTQFSPNGPQSPADWDTIQAAYEKMTANATGSSTGGLPSNDPVVAQAASVLQQLQKATHNPPVDTKDLQNQVDSAQGDYDKATADAKANPGDETKQGAVTEAGDALTNAKSALDAAVNANANGNFHIADKDTWDAIGKAPLDGFLTTLKGGAEIDMLNLQSLVSQRQTIVQLVTGMMGKYDQTQEAAAAKVGS